MGSELCKKLQKLQNIGLPVPSPVLFMILDRLLLIEELSWNKTPAKAFIPPAKAFTPLAGKKMSTCVWRISFFFGDVQSCSLALKL